MEAANDHAAGVNQMPPPPPVPTQEPLAANVGGGSELMQNLINGCSMLYPNHCCRELITHHEVDDDCLKVMISKSLGYGIIGASTLVKMPQLLKLIAAKSGAGLSFVGSFMELLAMTFNASYSIAKKFPFSAWGEVLFLIIEQTMITFFTLFYEKKVRGSYLFLVLYGLLTAVLMSGSVPIEILWYLQATNLPLAVIGKMMQAAENLKNGHTGQLSLLTVTLLFLGCVARIFTSIQETGDKVVIYTFLSASLANFVLVAQVLYYWKATNRFLQKQAKKKKN